MKKSLFILIISLFFVIPSNVIGYTFDESDLAKTIEEVKKRTYCTSGQYELTIARNDRTIPKGVCYDASKYEEAKQLMRESVSNFESVSIIIEYGSNTKIVNAKYALLDIDRNISSETNSLYLTATTNNNLTYFNGWYSADAAFIDIVLGTTDRAKLKLSAFEGYLKEETMTGNKASYNIVPISLLGLDNSGRHVASYYYVNNSNELIHYIAYNIHSNKNYSTNNLGIAPDFLEKGVRYYSYDGIYFYQNDLIKMLQDYYDGTTINSVNSTKPYYNYYLYMPYRLKSNYTKEDIDNYIENRWGIKYTVKTNDTFESLSTKYEVTEDAIKEMNNITSLTVGSTIYIPTAKINFEKYFILNEAGTKYVWNTPDNQTPTLTTNITMLSNIGKDLISAQEKFSLNSILTLGLAINESGNGKSFLAFSKNNIFGINANDSNAVNDASRFNSIEDCILYFNDRMINYLYADPGIYSDEQYSSYYYGLYFGNKAGGLSILYSSDAYWGEKAASHYYAFEKANGMLDYNNQKRIAIKTSNEELSIMKEASTTSSLLYKVKANAFNVPMVVLGEETGSDGKLWYKIQTDIALDSNRDRISLASGTFNTIDRTYNSDYSYGYIEASKVIIPSEGVLLESVEGEYYFDSITYDEESNTFNFKGALALKSYDNKKDNSIQFNLIAYNIDDEEETSFTLDRWLTGYPFEIPNTSSLDYSGAWFNGNVNLDNLKEGDYLLYITNTLNNKRAKVLVSNSFGKEIKKVTNENQRGYLFRTNYYLKTNQVELFIRDEGLISDINNPTIDNMFNEYSAITLPTIIDGKLNLKGTSFNVKGDYSETSLVERWIILENIETYKRTIYDNISSITKGDYDVVLRQSDNLSKLKAWYETSIDLTNLDPGTYTIYIRSKTGSIDDYGELTNIFTNTLNITNTYNNKTYLLSINSNKRNRVELTVTNIEESI